MKKFVLILFFIVPMLIYSAAPLMVHAECDFSSSFLAYPYPDGDKLYLQFHCLDRNDTEGFLYYFELDNDNVILSSDFSDGIFSLTLKNNDTFYQHYIDSDNKHFSRSYSFSKFTYDSNSKKFICYTNGGSIWYMSNNYVVTDFDTNIVDLNYNPLNLSVSFEPDLSGTVSRTSVHNGKEYTSTTLDLHVTNNGDDAQFSMFIVPSGDDITFPDSIVSNNQGFIGNPVYAYVTDEWLAFSVAGFQGNALYAPCVWHCVPSGYSNQIYHIPWNHMCLSKNTSYDVVVYGVLNSITGIDKGVDASISDAVEIYRSTFTIIDPAEYNPSGDAFGDHPWNPNDDHSSLWNTSSAYRDDNGNVVIKGQTREGGGFVLTDKGFVTLDTFSSSSMPSSIRRGFDNFLGFVNYIFNRLPGDLSTIYKYGYLSVVVLCIIKAVFT